MIKSSKNVGGKSIHFCLGPKTGIGCQDPRFTLRSNFLCLVVHFYKYFWFLGKTEIVSEKVYAAFWLVLEITSLNLSNAVHFYSNYESHCCKFVFLGTHEGLKKFLDTDGVYGKAAPDHDEL